MNCIITGIDGYSGSIVKNFLQRYKIDCIGVSRKFQKNRVIKWDLTKKNNSILNADVEWIIHTAAIHKISDYSKKFNKNKKKKYFNDFKFD